MSSDLSKKCVCVGKISHPGKSFSVLHSCHTRPATFPPFWGTEPAPSMLDPIRKCTQKPGENESLSAKGTDCATGGAGRSNLLEKEMRHLETQHLPVPSAYYCPG